MKAIETIQLRKSFGALTVADAIDFQMEQGARNALIGPNGAGKTTFVNLVSGALRPSSGTIRLNGEDVTGLEQAQRVKRGLVRTFQINMLFRGLSVLENVVLAIAEREGVAADFIRPAGRRRALIDEAYMLLDRLGLGPEAMKKVSDLAYGRQRLTEIAVALGLNPNVLLLDEPAAGVPSGDVGTIIDVIERLPAGIAILLIDHDMDLVFRIARHITVLAEGRILAEGPPEAISENPKVRQVYLGERKRR
jgi:branched-chain amino acid transport system ATP-binding protein